MSIAVIKYGYLKSAATSASDVAKKLGGYAGELYNEVYDKLSKYNGECQSYINSAKTSSGQKVNELSAQQKRFEKYSQNITSLQTECVTVDKAVKSKVSTLTASFKARNNITISDWELSKTRFKTALDNSNAFSRWISSSQDKVKANGSHLKGEISEWYNYEGGKESLKAFLSITCDIFILVAGVVSAISTFLLAPVVGLAALAATIVFAATIINAVIDFGNIRTDIKNEKAAYQARKKGDPATASRLSEINKTSDYFRSSFIYGDDGEEYYYNASADNSADALDITASVCTVIQFVDGAGKLLTKGGKWLTSNKDFKLKNVFSKDGITNVMSGITNKAADVGESAKNIFKADTWKNVGKSIKRKDWTAIKEGASSFFKDNLGNNFLKEYNAISNFKDTADAIKNGKGAVEIVKNVKDTADTFKHITSAVKDLNKSKNVDDLVGTVIGKTVYPSIGLAKYDIEKNEYIVLDDFVSLGEKYDKIMNKDSNSPYVPDEVIKKLSTISDFNVSITKSLNPNPSLKVIMAK